MNKKWFAALAACALVLFAAGCSNGSDGSGGTEPESEPVAVESVEIYPRTLSLTVGVTGELQVRILPAEATGVTVQWSSSKETVATVGNDGTVKAVKVGRATITARAGDKADTCEVTVSAHTHNYVSFKCTSCGLDKPSFKDGDIDDRGNLTAYTGNGTTVEIPKGVTCIKSEVFKDCTSLTSVTIPEGMTRIESSAFKGCTGLASVTIPDGVTYIAYQAFEDCSNLASVTIPDSVTYIGFDAFSGCTSLKEIQFKGTMEEWKAINGSDGLPVPGIQCSDGYIGVKDAPAYLTMDGTIVTGYTDGLPADLTIPDGTTKIGEEAFKDCKTLTSVTIPDGVTEIAGNAFNGCTSLVEVTIGDGVENIDYYAFQNCTSLASVTIPASVTSIGSDAFKGCTSLKEIQFKGTVEQWKAIDGSDDVKILYIECEGGYIGVKDAPAYLKISERTVTGYTEEIPADLIIPDGVTAIERVSFYNCTRLESVTIPTSVTSIADCGDRNNSSRGAFENCTNLTSVTINNGMESIGSCAFAFCTKLTSVTIPDSVTSIGVDAFYGCTSLKEIQFKGTVAQWNAIDGINDITIPCIVCNDEYIGIKDLPAYLIVSGTTVTGYTGEVPENLAIPEGLTSINSNAFKGCTKLTSVTIPKSMTNIKGAAFHNCTSLTDITFLDSETTIEDAATIFLIGAFEGCTNLKTVTMGNGVIKIGSYAFKGCTSLASVTIPGSVTSIGKYAFYGCTSLTTITIPDSVTSIGDGAFAECTSLTGVAIPDRVTSIGEYAFYKCTSLTDVAIPDRVTSIGENAFYKCTDLTSVTIPGSVRKIGKLAFYECTKLTKVKYLGTEEEWNNIKGLDDSYLSGKTIYGKDSDGNEVTWKCN